MGRDENKLYYTIGEVAEMFQVNESLPPFLGKRVRYSISPKIRPGDAPLQPRRCGSCSVDLSPGKEKKLTLAGARKQLKDNKEGVKRTHEVIARLMSIREELTPFATSCSDCGRGMP